MKQKKLVLLFSFFLLSFCLQAQMDPENDLIPAPYKSSCLQSYDSINHKWDSVSFIKYYFLPNSTHLVNCDIFEQDISSNSWILSYILAGFYSPINGHPDSMLFESDHNFVTGKKTFSVNSDGLVDTAYTFNGATSSSYYYKTFYIYSNKLLKESYYLKRNYTKGLDTIYKNIYFRDSNSRIVSYISLGYNHGLRPSQQWTDTGLQYIFNFDSSGRVRSFVALEENRWVLGKWDSTEKTVFEYDTKSGISSTPEPITNVSIFPNPFNESVTIQDNTFQGKVQISITDITGRMVQQCSSNSEELSAGYTLHLDNIPSGMYFLKCTDGLKQDWSKIIKE